MKVAVECGQSWRRLSSWFPYVYPTLSYGPAPSPGAPRPYKVTHRPRWPRRRLPEVRRLSSGGFAVGPIMLIKDPRA